MKAYIHSLLCCAIGPFCEVRRGRDEMLVLRALRRAIDKKRALEAAAREGNDVAIQLEITEREVERLLGVLPRGSVASFVDLLLLCLLTVPSAVLIYHRFHDILPCLYGPGDWTSNWALVEYRPHALRIWIFGSALLASPSLVAAFSIALSVGLWYVQGRLQRRYARLLLRSVAAAVALGFLFLAGALTRLLMIPLVLYL